MLTNIKTSLTCVLMCLICILFSWHILHFSPVNTVNWYGVTGFPTGEDYDGGRDLGDFAKLSGSVAKHGKVYVTIAKKILDKGNDYTKETERLRRILEKVHIHSKCYGETGCIIERQTEGEK